MSTFTNYETKAASEYHIVRLPVGHEVTKISDFWPKLEKFSQISFSPVTRVERDNEFFEYYLLSRTFDLTLVDWRVIEGIKGHFKTP